MKHESEFGIYLREAKRSARTSKPFSAKVDGNTVSRCKLVERALRIELSGQTLGTNERVQKVIDAIRVTRLGATEKRQYAYNEHILAVRTYVEFLAWREAT